MNANIVQDTQNVPNEKSTTGSVAENLEQLELLDTDSGEVDGDI